MEDLLQSVDNLFSLLDERKMNYVLVGGIALLQYIQGRNTEDIDLILNVTALQKLPEIKLTNQSEYFARGTYQNLQIDFLLTKNPLFAHVQTYHTTPQPFFERTITSATVKGLLLLKLYALPSLYRQGDFARVGLYENDVATLMFYYSPDMQEIHAELASFISNQDLTAIQDIVLDLTQRIARFQRNQE
ncbi:hypothetical protein [Candidatus Chloroploca sp. Khr17]|uniref:hypothetical protein n=1 Tax=Candidatus Chloroploca sp. Khr17 TaxID=2496869 RepID=UPI001F107F07|nr:hypothetical protein [Candidatus Chloroploca sp. Khr17]